MLRYALFDLDNTLYPASNGVMREIGRRMNQFMTERLGIPAEKVRDHRDALLSSHGTTLNGLRRSFAIDPDEFLAFVHDIPLERLLSKDDALDRMLTALPLRKVVFTNADAAHARRVLTRLGVIHHFESIIDIHLVEFCNKPDPRAYQKALAFIDARPEECVLLEDYPANIKTARAMGMTTVLVGGESDAENGDNENVADYAIASVVEFTEIYTSQLTIGR
jgi:putative hydrolase of the HAD superfamily